MTPHVGARATVLAVIALLLPEASARADRLEFDGYVYEGEVRNGYAHGRGRVAWSDGTSFDGCFKNSHPQRGVLHYSDGTSCIGIGADFFNQDYEKDGQGTCQGNGWGHFGLYRNDYRHGQGMMRWDDGDFYNGEFANGAFHGVGAFGNNRDWEGTRYCAEYRNGDFVRQLDWSECQSRGFSGSGFPVWDLSQSYQGACGH